MTGGVRWLAGIAALCLLMPREARAELGSPEVCYEGSVGPYHLRADIHPPDVVPGLAQIELHSADPDLRTVKLLALPLESHREAFLPTPDQAVRSATDPSQLIGQLWLMSPGSWQVRLTAEGERGGGEVSIPVPALPTRVAGMPLALGGVLLGLLVFLGLGAVSIVGAAAREGQLDGAVSPTAAHFRRGRQGMWIAAGMVCLVVWFGEVWWSASARAYAKSIYRPLSLSAHLEPNGGLLIAFDDQAGLSTRSPDDLVGSGAPDLVVVQLPGFDRIWHLHPRPMGDGRFEQSLPEMPPGRYRLFASLVHEDGLQETSATELELPAASAGQLEPDDAMGRAGPIGNLEGLVAALPNGGRLVLQREAALVASKPAWLRFQVKDRQGRPATDLEPMAGAIAEATILREDGSVFAELSTHGSVSAASWKVANPGGTEADGPTSELAFPYEFPQPGRYRVFVQLRRAGQNEIAILDLRVL